MKKIPGAKVAYAGYVFVLVGFISLGLFVVALARARPFAVLIGGVAVTCFAIGVGGFRLSARRGGGLFTVPVAAVDRGRYAARYRGVVSLSTYGRHHRSRRPVPSVHGRYKAFRAAARAPQPRMRRAH
ncbi:hypothetical protein [Mycobacterium sp. C31M]